MWGEPSAFDELPQQDVELQPIGPQEVAYLQFTSGSTGTTESGDAQPSRRCWRTFRVRSIMASNCATTIVSGRGCVLP